MTAHNPLLFLTACSLMLSSVPLTACAEEASKAVEIVINGKPFASIHDYRRDQIKTILLRSLSSVNLQEFSEEELSDIFAEVRSLQFSEEPADDGPGPEGQAKVKKEAQNLNPAQMQAMLDEYLKSHAKTRSLDIDPGKVKNVIIDPGVQSKADLNN